MKTNTERDEALSKVKEIFDDGFAEINGTVYTFGKMTHKHRVKVFSFFSGIQHSISVGDFGFLDFPTWPAIESVISNNVLIDDVQLSKIPAHWDNHPADYLTFVTSALAVISYPLLAGGNGA